MYRGVPLKKVLKIACGGVLPECKHLEFIGADTYFKEVLPVALTSLFLYDTSLERGRSSTTPSVHRGVKSVSRVERRSCLHGR